MDYDVIIIGGSFAGLSAATILGRAHRSVLIIDHHQPRNRFSEHSHGFFAQDGDNPQTMIAKAKAQVLAYASVTFHDGEAVAAYSTDHGFTIDMADGKVFSARKLIIATGVTDKLPDLPGIQERWGKTVLHCPYCHAYEISPGSKIGVLDSSGKMVAMEEGKDPVMMAVRQALLMCCWGQVTYFANGFPLAEPCEKSLRDKGIAIEYAAVESLIGRSPDLQAVRLKDGRDIEIDALFSGFPTLMTPLATQLGCELIPGMWGPMIRIDDRQETTVKGAYAAGDVTMHAHNITLAAADGVRAGIAVHHALVFNV